MPNQKSIHKQYTNYFHTIKSTSNHQEHPTEPKQAHYLEKHNKNPSIPYLEMS